ncbi:Lrp/AsnC family transcriptional regulator [bacterium]|nr:Lrp/AsnC family transcriptional regulator [bacterium]
MAHKLDKKDKIILDILQKNAKTTNADIAKALGMAPSAALERVKKLESRGYIDGYHALLNKPQLSLGLTAFVSVRTKVANYSRNVAIELTKLDHVLEVYEVVGEASYLVKVCARDTDQLSDVLREGFGKINEISSTISQIVLKTDKNTTIIPLDAIND